MIWLDAQPVENCYGLSESGDGQNVRYYARFVGMVFVRRQVSVKGRKS